LADVAGSWLPATAGAGLEEERLAAVEEHAAIGLDAGRHHETVATLSVLVAQHPRRERLVGLLMTALHRCGRSPDALAVFRVARQWLARELGIEPGDELQRVHRYVLGAQSSPVPSATTAAGIAVPRQLPTATTPFVGRVEDLARLDGFLKPDGDQPSATAVVITTIGGTAGVGKTALAVHWAHLAAGQFPDGQLYVNLRGFDSDGAAMDPAEALRGFLVALQVSAERIPATLTAQTGLYRSLLAGRRMLIVLDNARDADQVRPLLPGVPGCLAVVTSRDQLVSLVAAEGARPLMVNLLPVADARELLARRLGPDRIAAEPEATDEIITRCARLPLALGIVAARAATNPGFPLAALATELGDNRDGPGANGLDAFDGGNPAADVRTVFSWSYRTVSAPAARLFRLLGSHPGPDIATSAAASLARTSAPHVRRLLAELARAQLITEHTPGRYTFHDLLRAYAIELAGTHDAEADRRAALDQILSHYLHTADIAGRLLSPHRHQITLAPAPPGIYREQFADAAQAQAWFGAEQPVLLAVVNLAVGTGFDTHAWQLAWAMTEFLDRRGHWHDQAIIHHTAVEAARRLGDLAGQAHSHRALGWACLRLSRYDDAHGHLGQALTLFRSVGDPIGAADVHRNLGWVHERQGQHREALQHDRRALDLYRAGGDLAGAARALSNIGWDYTQLGNYQLAIAYCEQALAPHQEIGNRRGEAATLDTLGYAHHHLSDHEQATICYQKALDLYRDLGDRYNEADTLTHLGDTQLSAGDRDAARRTWQDALSILDQLGHTDAEQIRARLHPPPLGGK
jgi:tetratricopeptide (TPR) repeat protein